MSQQPYGTVLIKAEKILSFLSLSNQAQPLHVIAKETGMTNSTVSKILTTLELIGYVRRDDATKTYTLGSTLIKYANQFLANLDLSKVAFPYLKELHGDLDETVHLSVRQGDEILYVNKLESQRPIVVTTSRIGFSKPMYASAMGKAILAELSEEELAGYLSRNELKGLTPNTITDPEALRRELALTRERGYAIDNSEEQSEVFCIGTTITSQGKNQGAFSVSIPTYRRTPEREQQVIQAVLATKAGILKELEQFYLYM